MTGNANVKISKIDVNNPNFSFVNPMNVAPNPNSNVSIEFMATADPKQFEVLVNGRSSIPVIYDAGNTTSQEINVGGLSIEINGIPNSQDKYSLTKYIEPTAYEEGQSIEFNGLKTALKGKVKDLDNFTLRQSGVKDIFATMQDSIDALRVIGEDSVAKAQREMSLDMARHQIDNSMKNISSVRTSVGARMNTIDNQRESTQDFKLTSQKTLSNLEDLDMVAAISDFSQQKDLLDITQKTFMKLQDLSLFKLL